MTESEQRSVAIPSPSEGWVITTMGEVADVIGGGTPDANDPANFARPGAGIAWLTPADLSGFADDFIERGRRDLSINGLRGSSARLLPPGTVLMSSRAPIGYVAIARRELATNQGFKSFVCHKDIVPEYVLYWLKFIEPVLQELGSGTTFAEISGSRAKNIPLLLPPTAEQRRVVDKLAKVLVSLSASRKRVDGARQILDNMGRALLGAAVSGKLTENWRTTNDVEESGRELLQRVARERERSQNRKRQSKRSSITDHEPKDLDDLPELPELPEGWGLARVGFVVEMMQYGTSTKADASSDSGVPVLRMGNIQDGALDFSELKYIYPKKEDLAPYVLKRGDILFNRTNSPELVGKAAVFRIEDKYVFASYLIRLRCDRALMVSEFLNAWINSPWGRAWARRVRTDGVSQSNINTVKLGAMPVPVPPLDEQREIINRLRGLQTFAESIEDHVHSAAIRSSALAEAILGRAFRGELVPTEAELAQKEGRAFESAAGLLSRIQRQSQGPTSQNGSPSRGTGTRKGAARRRASRRSLQTSR